MSTTVIDAQKKFANDMWPTTSHEDWRRSDPNLIPFSKLEADVTNDEKKMYANIEEQITKAIAPHTGISYIPFSPNAVSSDRAKLLEDLLQRSISHDTDRVDSWRLGRLENGTAGIIVVEDNTKIETPIRIVIEGADTDLVYAPQICVLAGSQVKYTMSILVEGAGFFLPAVYCHASKNSEIHYSFFQNADLDSIVLSNVFLGCMEDAQVKTTSAQFGSMISVDRIHGRALGERSDVILGGYYYGSEDQLLDMRAYQHHEAPNSGSRADYHGVACDEAHTVFRGLIGVGEQAINTDAYLTNKNLLLSEDARMDSIPCLNINTNEVKCSHGSTTGDLDPQHVFYLMSRGLSKDDAKHLLIEGFFQAVFDPIFDEENEKALEIIRSRMTDI